MKKLKPKCWSWKRTWMSCSWTTAQVSSEVADTRAFERTVEVALVEVDVLVEVFDVDVALVVVAAFVVASSSASEVVAAAVETAALVGSSPAPRS